MVKKKNIPELTIDELIKFNKVKRIPIIAKYSIKFILYPFYVLFWGSLITILIALAFSVNISKQILIIMNISTMIYPVLMIYLIIIIMAKYYFIINYNRNMYKQIIKERRNKK